MILPTKFIREEESIIGISSLILGKIDSKRELLKLWEDVKKFEVMGNFKRFVLALDLLYMLGLIDIKKNEIFRIKQ